jgi:DNA polymerase-3 subunit chi
MTEISFYHLTKTPLEKALPLLLEKVIGKGLKAVIYSEDKELLTKLDSQLWTYGSQKFLPHGTEEDEFKERQPVYLTTKEDNPNAASVLVLVDGAQPAFLKEFDRVVDIFDGLNEDDLAAARARWGDFKKEGHALKYLQQNEQGGWEEGQKAA